MATTKTLVSEGILDRLRERVLNMPLSSAT